jgi:predicted enzyme related to lactoylglutathione lyase
MAAPAIVHIEFKSSDFARTSAFYAKLFDWQTQQNASGSYMKADGADGPSGGWVRADLVQSPGPIAYLVVDDLEAKMDAVEKAGGRVLVRSMPFAGGGEGAKDVKDAKAVAKPAPAGKAAKPAATKPKKQPKK